MARPCPTGRHDEHNVYAENCPCRALLDLISNKWSALVIGMLDERSAVRFSELQAALPGVGSKMLTQTLRRLEAASLVERSVYAEVPPRVEYTLSELGRSAAVPLGQIRAWAEEHIDQVEFLNRKWSEQN
ncbi:winged helix-turn-helix transcriptional regulator [Mycolicibacterium fortuitum]|uniref:HxlR family transcriptional regulator n=2 Tax=Mycolicibacterium fortuitum TaxID=1766 RepID=A0A378UBY7_MYCFO|nr:helix-turn-helix domain-containing protein [Mycolicibacterium fortuitum]AIY46709.1 Transcriptional regulator, HxlR family [Mycobacterium sp. VKM Ac-1817D]CRL79531.1 cinnamoyl ester hydrolase [Mycolicibacter nonchromogenicus]EJZ09793.1 cinnamoyl ester hydrolase [Mycolicibacterium fortuitum subsp. fortuitum DSM 46621 = ATCC 6841 = JCM 6387]WEV30154.1 helix-turn-helix transcriptional regulator [Mycolicibacterium fortuitum]CRL57595.1 cinnamoyl ester hydrolase [Mycolicibacterium fortuitum subsp.